METGSLLATLRSRQAFYHLGYDIHLNNNRNLVLTLLNTYFIFITKLMLFKVFRKSPRTHNKDTSQIAEALIMRCHYASEGKPRGPPQSIQSSILA
jgi:hypothetical protein